MLFLEETRSVRGRMRRTEGRRAKDRQTRAERGMDYSGWGEEEEGRREERAGNGGKSLTVLGLDREKRKGWATLNEERSSDKINHHQPSTAKN